MGPYGFGIHRRSRTSNSEFAARWRGKALLGIPMHVVSLRVAKIPIRGCSGPATFAIVLSQRIPRCPKIGRMSRFRGRVSARRHSKSSPTRVESGSWTAVFQVANVPDSPAICGIVWRKRSEACCYAACRTSTIGRCRRPSRNETSKSSFSPGGLRGGA